MPTTPLRQPTMPNNLRRCLAAWALPLLAGPALAGVVTLQGALDDPLNTALVAPDLGAAQFIDDLATANNVALHVLHVAVGGNVTVQSTGFATGGIDPYFTLFAGTVPATATFVDSNILNAQSVGGDFTQSLLLAAGDYTVAIGVYENMSFAENQGSGFLADGFIGLGGPAFFGNGRYAFSVTLPDGGTVPEPSAAALVLAALLALAAAAPARRRVNPAPTTTGG